LNIHPRYTNLELFIFISAMLTIRPAFWGARKSRIPQWWSKRRRARRV